jgi:hypothetical protein
MNTAHITKQITALKARMVEAQVLAARFAEMQAAAEFVSKLGPTELAKLEALLVEVETAERVRRDAVSRIRITAIRASVNPGERIAANTPHVVSFIERCSDWEGYPIDRDGTLPLHGLSPEVWAALLASPKQLPAVIASLDDDPAEAVRMHIRAMHRGYM